MSDDENQIYHRTSVVDRYLYGNNNNSENETVITHETNINNNNNNSNSTKQRSKSNDVPHSCPSPNNRDYYHKVKTKIIERGVRISNDFHNIVDSQNNKIQHEKEELNELNQRLNRLVGALKHKKHENEVLEKEIYEFKESVIADGQTGRKNLEHELEHSKKDLNQVSEQSSIAKIRASRSMYDLSMMKDKFDEEIKHQNSTKEKIRNLENQRAQSLHELNFLRENFESKHRTMLEDASKNEQLREQISLLMDSLDREQERRIDLECRIQTLSEHKKFDEELHQICINEMQQMSLYQGPNRLNDPVNFFNDELRSLKQRIREDFSKLNEYNFETLREEYERKCTTVIEEIQEKQRQDDLRREAEMQEESANFQLLQNEYLRNEMELNDLKANQLRLTKMLDEFSHQHHDTKTVIEQEICERDSHIESLNDEIKNLKTDLTTMLNSSKYLDAEVAIYAQLLNQRFYNFISESEQTKENNEIYLERMILPKPFNCQHQHQQTSSTAARTVEYKQTVVLEQHTHTDLETEMIKVSLRELDEQKRLREHEERKRIKELEEYKRRQREEQERRELEEQRRRELEEQRRRELEEQRRREEQHRREIEEFNRKQREIEEQRRRERELEEQRRREQEEILRREIEEQRRRERELEEQRRREQEEILRREIEEQRRREKELEEQRRRDAEEKRRRDLEEQQRRMRELEEQRRRDLEELNRRQKELEEQARRQREFEEQKRLRELEEQRRREEQIHFEIEEQNRRLREVEEQKRKQREMEEINRRQKQLEEHNRRQREIEEQIRQQKEFEEERERIRKMQIIQTEQQHVCKQQNNGFKQEIEVLISQKHLQQTCKNNQVLEREEKIKTQREEHEKYIIEKLKQEQERLNNKKQPIQIHKVVPGCQQPGIKCIDKISSYTHHIIEEKHQKSSEFFEETRLPASHHKPPPHNNNNNNHLCEKQINIRLMPLEKPPPPCPPPPPPQHSAKYVDVVDHCVTSNNGNKKVLIVNTYSRPKSLVSSSRQINKKNNEVSHHHHVVRSQSPPLCRSNHPAAILSHHHGSTSNLATVNQSSQNDLSNKYAIKHKANRYVSGAIGILETSLNGEFIILENLSSNKTVNLKGWYIHRYVPDQNINVIYKFNEDCSLTNGEKLKIFSKSSNNNTSTNKSNEKILIADNVRNWGKYSKFSVTKLINPEGVDKAVLTQSLLRLSSSTTNVNKTCSNNNDIASPNNAIVKHINVNKNSEFIQQPPPLPPSNKSNCKSVIIHSTVAPSSSVPLTSTTKLAKTSCCTTTTTTCVQKKQHHQQLMANQPQPIIKLHSSGSYNDLTSPKIINNHHSNSYFTRQF